MHALNGRSPLLPGPDLLRWNGAKFGQFYLCGETEFDDVSHKPYSKGLVLCGLQDSFGTGVLQIRKCWLMFFAPFMPVCLSVC